MMVEFIHFSLDKLIIWRPVEKLIFFILLKLSEKIKLLKRLPWSKYQYSNGNYAMDDYAEEIYWNINKMFNFTFKMKRVKNSIYG